MLIGTTNASVPPSFVQDRWTVSAPMDDARASFCALVLQDGNVIAIGGRGQTGKALLTWKYCNKLDCILKCLGVVVSCEEQLSAL